MAAKNYDPNSVAVIVGGHIVSGYADGTFVNVARNEDAFTLQVGSSGEGVRSKSNNKSGQITITLLQSSQSNVFLSTLAQLDEISNGGVVPVLVKDNNGTPLYSAETAWVKKVADSEYGREAGSREWVLETDELIAFVGGY